VAARSLILEQATLHRPESLAERLRGEPGLLLLRSAPAANERERFSFVVARPFLTLRSTGSRIELHGAPPSEPVRVETGNPWQLLNELMARFERCEELDLPLPLGGCFGYWGYGLRHHVEPKLPRRAVSDRPLPDCQLGFYDSLVAFDHSLGKTWVISTGLAADGSASPARAEQQAAYWRAHLASEPEDGSNNAARVRRPTRSPSPARALESNLSRDAFVARVQRAQQYIRAGDIYQVNLSQRLAAPLTVSGWEFYQRLTAISPAPFSAFLDGGDFQIASASPELFLRLSGAQMQTRPIKGTRPRASDPTRDAQWTYELRTSAKEMAELVMITDLLRNDLGKVCEFGSVQVPDLARLERFAQVQHLVSTVEGRLRASVSHTEAFAACFPGGSVTGAPKFRAMEIIDELEPIARGPYTGALGYLGFNRETQLSMIIRTAICSQDTVWFNVGAGIVADSSPAAEYEETLTKAAGFLAALEWEAAAGERSVSAQAPLDQQTQA